MARFSVYRMGTVYVLDVQAPLLETLNTRVVVPLIAEAKAPKPLRELNPIFTLQAERFVMLTQALATVPVKEFGKVLASLDAHQDEIMKAMDLLLTGF